MGSAPWKPEVNSAASFPNSQALFCPGERAPLPGITPASSSLHNNTHESSVARAGLQVLGSGSGSRLLRCPLTRGSRFHRGKPLLLARRQGNAQRLPPEHRIRLSLAPGGGRALGFPRGVSGNPTGVLPKTHLVKEQSSPDPTKGGGGGGGEREIS